ncbi:TIC110, chloroplastic-like protein [Drosera capensis]
MTTTTAPANIRCLSPRPILFPTSTLFPNRLLSSLRPSSSLHSTTPRRPRRRLLISNPRCSSSAASASPAAAPSLFGDKKELSGIHALVNSLPPPARYATSALVLTAAIAAGYGLGLRTVGTRAAALGAATALGAAGSAAVYVLNSCVPEVAAANLHNFVVGVDDPLSLSNADIEAIAARFGVSKQDEVFVAELSQLYFRYLSSVLPPGDESLKGNEVDSILKFKNALGIDDPEAASMHIELGRRIFRERLETEDKDANSQLLRAFQKLIYVSMLVFGEASTFLLPWKRVFNITDAQVDLAIRANAQRLYSAKLNEIGRDLDVKQLVELKQYQLSYRLSDELAEDMFKDRIRKLAEENISVALEKLTSRASTGGAKDVIHELNKILVLNNSLLSLRKGPDASRLACGVGPVSVVGGEYGKRTGDLKLLYRAYFEDALSGGFIEENKLADMNQLKPIFGLGEQEVEAIALDVTSKTYRRQLSQAVSSGELEAADSKAVFLQNLCDRLLLDPEKASKIHEEIYRQKLQHYIADKELSDQEVAALLRLRVMLCLHQKTVEAIHAEICGSVFEKVVKDALDNGYNHRGQASVRKAAHGLRLTRESALSIASKAVRKLFMNYIKKFAEAEDLSKSVQALEEMVVFNREVVTKFVADIKGESTDPKSEEPDEEEEKPKTEETWDSLLERLKNPSPKVLKQIQRTPVQTEITLRDDIPERQRSEIYKRYFLHCLVGGDKEKKLIGVEFPKEGDMTYYSLDQIGKILGLSEKVSGDIWRTFAEQAFRQEAEKILADGQLTKPKMNLLKQVEEKASLSPEYTQKVIEGITKSKVADAIKTAVRQGKLDIKKIRELKQSGVDVASMLPVGVREHLFRKSLDEIFSSGTGEVDVQELYETIPSYLSIDTDKAKAVVHERARARLTSLQIQALALLRQGNTAKLVSTLNDILACDEASPAEPFSWDVPQELSDLYITYMKSEPTLEKLNRLQFLLGINDTAAAALRGVIDRERALANEEEEFVF